MLSIIQRVSNSNVTVDNKIIGEISKGIMALVCFEKEDTEQNLIKMADKILNYRIFEDEKNKMNLSLKFINAELLIIPQFTLAVDTRKGLRPSFSDSCPPDIAKEMFEKFILIMNKKYNKVKNGIFGADMKVSLINDGPVTFTFKI